MKNIRKCPAQSNPHERIIPPAENNKRKRRFHSYLQNCAREGKLVQRKQNTKSEQNITGRRHTFQLSREQTSGNEPRTHFFLNRMATLWNNSPKEIALANSAN